MRLLTVAARLTFSTFSLVFPPGESYCPTCIRIAARISRGQLARSTPVSEQMAAQGIIWHFNPLAAPHFRGLWEAAIKSVKRHLFRAISNRAFSQSKLSSLLVQIEGCMNSHPLVLLSSDSACCETLTPAHFLIGRQLSAFPIEEAPGSISIRARWRELQATLSTFWKKRSSEYLNTMQQRPKWRTALRNLKVDDVIIQEATPPSTCRFGRIVEVRLGPDGLVSRSRSCCK